MRQLRPRSIRKRRIAIYERLDEAKRQFQMDLADLQLRCPHVLTIIGLCRDCCAEGVKRADLVPCEVRLDLKTAHTRQLMGDWLSHTSTKREYAVRCARYVGEHWMDVTFNTQDANPGDARKNAGRLARILERDFYCKHL